MRKHLIRTTFFILSSTVLLFLSSCEKEPEQKEPEHPFYRIYNVGGTTLETNTSNDQVNMIFQVLDEQYRGVPGLNDIALYELTDYQDDMTQSPEANVQVDSFGTIPVEIYTVMLLDLSKSVEGMVPQIKQAALTFIKNSLNQQHVAIYTFDGDAPKLRIDFTTNRTQLEAAINSLPETSLGTSTNLYEALITAVQRLPEEEYTVSGITQSNVMLFTDGKEEASPQNKQQALSAAKQATVFVAALQSSSLDEPTLLQLAGVNNYFVAENADQLEGRFSEIQKDISLLSRSVYWLYYNSPRKGITTWDIRLAFRKNRNSGTDRYALGTYSSSGF